MSFKNAVKRLRKKGYVLQKDKYDFEAFLVDYINKIKEDDVNCSIVFEKIEIKYDDICIDEKSYEYTGLDYLLNIAA